MKIIKVAAIISLLAATLFMSSYKYRPIFGKSPEKIYILTVFLGKKVYIK